VDQDHHDSGVERQRNEDGARAPILEDDGGTEHAQSKTDRDQYNKISSLQDEIKRGEKWMIWLTGAMAFFALSTVIVGILQWNVMSRQLDEMHTTGKDTHDLAVATGSYAADMKTLAEQTTSQAAQTKSLAEQTTSLASAAKDSAIASNRQWHEMQQQVGIMRNQLADTRKAAKDSADAIGRQLSIADTQASSMKTLADATKDAAETSKQSMANAEKTVSILQQTLHVDQRAWLHATISESFKYWPFPLGFRVWPKNYVVRWLNTGKTPAHNITAAVIAEFAERPTLDYAREGFYAVESLEPNAIRQTVVRNVRGVVAGTPNKSVRLYIHGVAIYDDMFQGHHWMEFCYIMERNGDATVCDNHNGDDSQTSARPPLPPRQAAPPPP